MSRSVILVALCVACAFSLFAGAPVQAKESGGQKLDEAFMKAFNANYEYKTQTVLPWTGNPTPVKYFFYGRKK